MSSFLPLRLSPGDDLRGVLEAHAAQSGAAFVVSGIGSLGSARLRLAGAETDAVLDGPLEILSLAGSLSADGAHLHMAVSDVQGRVTGGHVGRGCTIRTTAELLLAPLDGWELTRQFDAATGYPELVVQPR